MGYQDILYGVEDRVATVTLNRPDRMNAWTPTMEREVREAMAPPRTTTASAPSYSPVLAAASAPAPTWMR
jgi:Enoyl-CoA hydratase (EC 4.2.1.17)